MQGPKVSIIMPVYNCEKYLEKAITSILDQTFTDFELIIINDGSTDDSEKIVLSFFDKRIRYYKNVTNLKLIKTLNYGIDLANGNFISRMDADDIAFPTLLEKQIKVFSTNLNIDIVNIRSLVLSEDGAFLSKSKSNIFINDNLHKYIVFFQNLISHPGVMIKTDLLRKYRYKDDGTVIHFEDCDLWYRVLHDGYKVYTIHEFLLFYRNNSSGIVKTYRKKNIMKRVDYCKSILINEQFLCFSENEIKLILGEYEIASLSLLKDLDRDLTAYVNYIISYKMLEKSEVTDIIYWKNYILLFISTKSLLVTKINVRAGIFLYIIKKLYICIKNNCIHKRIFDALFPLKFSYVKFIKNNFEFNSRK